MGIFKRLKWFFKQEWKAYSIGVFFLVVVAIIQVISPRIVGNVIDEINMNTLTSRNLLIQAGIVLAAGILQYVFRYIWRLKIWGTSAKLEKILRSRLFHHFTKMDAIFFQKYRTGDLMAHATNDLNAIRLVAGAGILTLADSISSGGITLITMFFFVNWKLTLIAMLPLPALTIVARLLGQKMHKNFRKAQASFSGLNDKTQESITGVKVIKTFGEEHLDIEDFENKTRDVVGKNKEVYKIDALFGPSINFIIGISYGLSLIFGGLFIKNGEMTVGALVTFFSYIGLMRWPMLAAGRLLNVLERGSASYNRIEELMEEESHIVEIGGATNQPLDGDLTVDIDHFEYDDADHDALTDIHFTLKKGETLGIVGRTGSGKTTLFNLLLREYDQYSG